ncbi:hypothetical protein SmJEL517_g05949 [Synchytrium microbalum]|uniref:Zn(2)-C6 fungal-type domain-containing protein n=1 Tax=Synchytrium microbalum TaxID=1806994 RepID=A0A507BYR6_9FUNG|nr:uncharacterized protein SmJEL517_g05949 [Synchytrium microbalum]TPX30485.1 hypothetical protein SmJEL517_g05949 [Synchytrium microbalum]
MEGEAPVAKAVIACERCRAKKRKCCGTKPTCSNCQRAISRNVASACVYPEAPRKRGPKKGYREDINRKLSALEALIKPLQTGELQGKELNEVLEALKATAGRNTTASYEDDDEDQAPPQKRQRRPESSGGPLRSNQQVMYDDEEGEDAEPQMVSAANVLEMMLLDSPGSPGNSGNMMTRQSSASSWVNQSNVLESMFAPPSAPIFTNLSSIRIDEQTYASLGLSQDFFNMVNAPTPTTYPSIREISGGNGGQLSPLELHLVQVYFTYAHGVLPLFHEKEFFSELAPINKHPSYLLNVIYAMGALYSRHPALYSEYQSPTRASEIFYGRAVEAIDPERGGPKEGASLIQTQLLLGVFDYGALQSARAFMWTGMAFRIAIKCNMMHADDWRVASSDLYHFSAWKKETASIDAETRRRIFISCMKIDAFASMISGGLPFSIDETECRPLLAASDERERRETLHGVPGIADDEPWRSFLAGRPMNTVFDAKPPLSSLTEDPNGVGHLISSPSYSIHMWELSVISRQVGRYVRQLSHHSPIDNRNLSPSMSTVMSLLPPTPDGVTLYNAMLRWRATLPPEYRVWDSLEFFTGDTEIPLPHPSSSPAWTRNASLIFNEFFFLATLSMLHQPTITNTSRIYPVQYGKDSAYLSSAGVLIACHKILVYVIRSVHAVEGIMMPFSPDDSITARDIPISALYPPPPSQCADNPIMSFTVYSICAINLAYVSSNPIYRGKQMEFVNDIKTVIIPYLENLSRIWPVSATYSARLKKLLETLTTTTGSGTVTNYAAPDLCPSRDVAQQPDSTYDMSSSSGSSTTETPGSHRSTSPMHSPMNSGVANMNIGGDAVNQGYSNLPSPYSFLNNSPAPQ